MFQCSLFNSSLTYGHLSNHSHQCIIIFSLLYFIFHLCYLLTKILKVLMLYLLSIIISQYLVDSIATNLYAAYFGMCSCKLSQVCNIQYCGHFTIVEMVLFQISQYFVDSTATNLYATYCGTCSCKLSKVCNIQSCGHFNNVEMVLLRFHNTLLIVQQQICMPHTVECVVANCPKYAAYSIVAISIT